MSLEELLTVSNVTKIYETGKNKVVGVQNISFCVRRGEFVSIIGHSGCGKSTLLRCIAGFEKITEGSIYLSGQKVKRPNPTDSWYFRGWTSFSPG